MSLKKNLVFGALIRPAMIKGVAYDFYLMNLMLSMAAFIGLSPFAGLVFFPVHAAGMVVSWYDPDFFTIFFTRFLKLPYHSNQSFWKVRAYEPF